MAGNNGGRDRLSIDVFPEEHKKIKAYAALHGQTIREYVLECVHKRLKIEAEKGELSGLAMHLDKDPVLRELWDNKKDSEYDKL
ncbi:MAG: hypothetical protein KKD11_01695 [Candidatus Omnitrophica bacterium]|nr:hypothetical protein [Candidatus Omnitrophota bacterium]